MSKISKLKIKSIIEKQISIDPTKLDLSSHSLNSIPAELFKLKKLEELNLYNNRIKIIPSEIMNLQNLRNLNLEKNKVEKIPIKMCNLTKLESLILSNNNISTIPKQVGQLPKLRKLYLSKNNIQLLPKEIGYLTSLKLLSLSSNKITELPIEIGQLGNLEKLIIDENYLTFPPPEIVSRGTASILNYLRSLLEGETDFLYEAKLLIVGEGGAGKTSLSNKIRDNNYELIEDEETTKGIDISPFYFDYKGSSFRMNIWDFGGQEIYHSTHQFFLTKRSLYTLVSDTRREDTDFKYWLNVVELLSDNSPLIILQNEKQDRQCQINEVAIRGRFENFKSINRVNLKTNRGLEALIQEITHQISLLPHIGTELPKTWVKIRSILEDDPRDYISVDDFLNICHESGVSDREKALYLSEYLHDLGVFLHFQDNPLLRKLVILKPDWATSAVYKLLDSNLVINNFGKFNYEDVKAIWHEEKYIHKYDELLELMMKFEICYKVQEENIEFVAPQLLSINEPNFYWGKNNNTVVKFQYDFLPKGVITRFIVRMNRYINSYDFVWKEGVILSRNNARASVIQSYDKNVITVKLEGIRKKELLTLVLEEFNKIHDSYPRIKVNTNIPCNCRLCKNSQKPHFFDYENLTKRVDKQVEKVQCDKSFEDVDVQDLIDETFTKNNTTKRTAKILKEELRNQIMNGEISGVLEKLSHALCDDPFLHDEITIRKASLSLLERKNNRNLIDYNTYERELSKIINSTLEFMKKIP